MTILLRSFAAKGSRDVRWKLEGEMRSREGLCFWIADITAYLCADGKEQ